MTMNDLQAALEQLCTERLECLADRLEADPDIEVTVGNWRPQCPMRLAGFNHEAGLAHAPERRFAEIWDQCATRTITRWRKLLHLQASGRATRSDVQALMRMVNATLAQRSSQSTSPAGSRTEVPGHPR